MIFDAQIAPAEIDIQALEEQDQVQVSLGFAAILSVGPQQAMALPLGVTRFGLSKEDALTHGQELIDAANKLPDSAPNLPSDFVVAKSMDGVDEAVKQVESLKATK